MRYRQMVVRESLHDVPVSRLMQNDLKSIDGNLGVRDLVDDYLMTSDQRAYPVYKDDRLAGLIRREDSIN